MFTGDTLAKKANNSLPNATKQDPNESTGQDKLFHLQVRLKEELL